VETTPVAKVEESGRTGPSRRRVRVEEKQPLPEMSTMNLDETDRALLQLLGEDARVSHRQLARELGLAQGTVTNRIRRLEQEGVIEGYRVALNAGQLGWTLTILAGLRIEKGRMIDVQQKISADPRVFAVYDVTGDWDSIVLARVKDRADLDNLTKTVFTLEGVSRSYTHVVLNTVKEQAFPSLSGKD